MTEETRQFIETWTERINLIEGNDLESVFERFTDLYTLHNRLYNESYRILEQTGRLTKPRYADHEKASIAIIEYLYADTIADRLRAKNVADIESVALLIKNNVFHLNLADGVPPPNIDMQLIIKSHPLSKVKSFNIKIS